MSRVPVKPSPLAEMENQLLSKKDNGEGDCLASEVLEPLGPHSSYRDIVRSSSIIGGAQGIRLLILMVQTKLVAVLLGPAGLGLVGLYQSAINLVGTVSGLGISGSAVRVVAEAQASGDPRRVARTVKVLGRACFATGLLGWMLAASLGWPLSVWFFGTSERAVTIGLLGVTLLFTNIATGQLALIQGLRRIGDLALFQVLSAIGSLVISVILYACLREQGIITVFIIVSVFNLAVSRWIARRVLIISVITTWRRCVRESSRLVSLGVALMWSGVLTTGVGLVTCAWITRDFGTEANGIYQAAWGISGAFAGFILQAMGTDFYPRLTAVANDDREVNRLVNEQTEVGILMALPGLLATLAFAPWVIRIFYTAKFLEASALLPWFVLGVMGSVISWPLGFIQLAKGATRVFATTETVKGLVLLCFTWFGLRWYRVLGVAMALAALYLVYVLGILWIAGLLSGFRWSRSVRMLLFRSTVVVGIAFAISKLFPPVIATASGGLLVFAASYLCLRRLAFRLGPSHRMSQILLKMGVLKAWFPPSLLKRFE